MVPTVSSPIKPNFALNLSRLRKALQISQEALARKISATSGIKITRSAVAQWEKGFFKPQLDTFVALCAALEATPNEILDINGVVGSSGDHAGEVLPSSPSPNSA